MLCQSCNKNNATVNLAELKNGKWMSFQLCEPCAQNTGVPPKHPAYDLLAGFVSKVGGKSKESGLDDRKCSCCGMSFRAFRAKGRLGCAKDYDLFHDELIRLLERIHGSARYVGRAPKGAQDPEVLTRLERRQTLLQLKRELREVVESEDYERAARLRDEIQSLEQGLSAKGESLGPASEGEQGKRAKP